MNTRILLVLGTVASLAASSAMAQQNQGTSTSGQPQQTAIDLPEACRSAAQASAQGDMMQKMQDMQNNTSQTVQGMMGQMNDTQKGLMEAMMKMNRPMMVGMMAKDADVAWICAMIPHHQGAIDMARAGLKGADNAESRKLAEETIENNERELKKLVAWIERNARKENTNEMTGSTK